MLKYFKFLLIICIILIFILFEFLNSGKFKVLDVPDYKTVALDLNHNFQIDENEIIMFDELYIPDTLSSEDKFLLEYLANQEARHFLLYKYVSFDSETKSIIVNDKDFLKFMTDSHLVLNFSLKDETAFNQKLKELKSNDYVILNIKSKRYHKLNCDTGIKSKNFKLVPVKFVPKDYIPCKSCINVYIPPEDTNTELSAKPQGVIDEGDIKIFPLGLNEIKSPQNSCQTEACKVLLNEINSAKDEILFAVYGLHNQDSIFNALINAQKRGIKIKWVSDYSTSPEDYYPDTKRLAEFLPDVNYDYNENKSQANKLMHNKFFIFDSQKVFTGSSNITQTDLTGFNANYSVLIDSKDIAKYYSDEFYQMYKGKFHNQKDIITKSPVILNDNTEISVYFSPKDKIITNKLIPLINNAKSTIDISIFYLTHKVLKDTLINANNRGVNIRIINDATNASNQFSVHKELRSNGIRVKTENFAGKNHSKIVIIDNETTVLGSMNFTSGGEKANDENVLIIKNPKIAEQMTQSFNKTWAQIDDKYLNLDPPAESPMSIYSCHDGVDNDFDGKVDGQDEGCQRR